MNNIKQKFKNKAFQNLALGTVGIGILGTGVVSLKILNELNLLTPTFVMGSAIGTAYLTYRFILDPLIKMDEKNAVTEVKKFKV